MFVRPLCIVTLQLSFKVLFLFSLASNAEKFRHLERTLANLTENHEQHIDELDGKHALETENLLDELNQKHQREMGQGIFSSHVFRQLCRL